MDDRLYSEAEKAAGEQEDKIAKALNDDEGGKDHSPELDAPDVDVSSSAIDINAPDIEEGDDLTTSIKLGEFVRGSSQLARAHDLSRTTEPQIGM